MTYTATSGSSSSLAQMSTTPPSHIPFLFHDPFAPLQEGTTMRREPGVVHPAVHHPAATAAGYHYSPHYDDTRRMSETPVLRGHSPRSHQDDLRRDSAPLFSRASISTSTGGIPTPRPVPQESPKGGTSISASPSPRPRLMRYKTSPARSTGLGLEITVRSSPSLFANPVGSSSRTSRGSIHIDRRDSTVNPGESANASSQPRRRSSGRGHWAAINVIPSSTASASSTQSLLARRGMTPRDRFESVDSAFPLRAGRDAFQREKGRWSESLNLTMPRRGSLAVVAAFPGLGGEFGMMSAGGLGGWHERRGSWAEGWGKK